MFSILFPHFISNLNLLYSPLPRILDRTYNLGGAYRLVMSKPSDVKWKFVRYDDPTLSLIPSDWDRLEKTQPPAAAAVKGIIPLAQWQGFFFVAMPFPFLLCFTCYGRTFPIHLESKNFLCFLLSHLLEGRKT
jgi:hypothetical protein